MELRTFKGGQTVKITGREAPGSFASLGLIPSPGDIVVVGENLVRVRRIRVDRARFVSVICDATAKDIADSAARGDRADCTEVGLGWVFPVQHWSWHGAP